MLRFVVKEIGRSVYRCAAAALDSLPASMRELIIDLCARIQVAFLITRRRNVEKNLSGIGVPAARETVLRIFRNHTRNIVEMFTASRLTTRRIRHGTTVHGLDILDAELEEKRGVVLVTAHVGNWEFGALFLASLGYRLHAVAGVQMNRFLTEALKEFKEHRGIAVVNPEHSYRKLFRAVRENGIVALLVDGDIFLEGARVPFFGRLMILPTGTVRLARGTGASIVGACCRNCDGGAHRIRIERIITADELTALTDDQALERVYAAAERYIRTHHDQWCIFRDFWGDRS